MRRSSWQCFLVLAALTTAIAPQQAEAQSYRQYYSSWTYYESKTYYVSTYYYKPYSTYSGYDYHYCVYYPSQPSYVYYYNPSTEAYWGRLDLNGKEGEQYSLLAEKDRKKNLEDIAPSAFPKPAKMPAIPGAKDGAVMEPIKDKPVIGKSGEKLPG